jgi:hypothetical protein
LGIGYRSAVIPSAPATLWLEKFFFGVNQGCPLLLTLLIPRGDISMMKMYRAVPRTDLLETTVLRSLHTSRVPVNVPYLVDNIWENLRPEYAPSRRHAIFASPSPDQALKSASKDGASDKVVCELVINDSNCRVAHLSKPDAKDHDDIRRLMCIASPLFAKLFHNMPDEAKLVYAPLFVPGTTAGRIANLLLRPELSALAEASDACTMWKEARFEPVPGHNGELFFNLSAYGEAILMCADISKQTSA